MLTLVSQVLNGLCALISLALPLAVALAALRRTILSESPNFDRYALFCALSFVVFYANLAALLLVRPAASPLALLVTGAAVALLWLLVRHHCDQRRRTWSGYDVDRDLNRV